MPEFLKLKLPAEARALLFSNISAPIGRTETIETLAALERVAAQDVRAPHPLPEFPRSTVDGYAVRAGDTYGASDSMPAYLMQVAEVPMGAEPRFALGVGQCALIHTGGMIPEGATAVVMLEHSQTAASLAAGDTGSTEIEILKAVAEGENTIRVGEDVAQGAVILRRGQVLGPAEIGGLLALGILSLRVVERPKIGLISSGDEVVDPAQHPRLGQVRDINAFTLSALVSKAGGLPVRYGIIPDDMEALQACARKALQECDCVIITAGSSASSRDMTAEVIDALGKPGVLVHGVNTRPGKPTILGVCGGKAVIGLPGNPVSALVNGYLFIVPLLHRLVGREPEPRAPILAQLTINLPSQAGREDWWPVKLVPRDDETAEDIRKSKEDETAYLAEPIFGKSNLIFTLASAGGLLRIPAAATGLSAGETVEVFLL
jgi:molybdopterin molybdotransferase